MCLAGLFKKPKAPSLPPPQPSPAPTPVPTPSEISPQIAGDARRKKLELRRKGLLDTIKTKGIVGQGPELAPASLIGGSSLG